MDQKEDLILCDKAAELIIGEDPVPSLDIEMDAIEDKLQRKMVEELQCIVCSQFPFKAKECYSCKKLFCKFCQIQLLEGNTLKIKAPSVDDSKVIQKKANSYQDKEGSLLDIGKGSTPEFDICCPNCQQKGDFLKDVNMVVKNCMEFCEFPHRCKKVGKDSGKD